MWEKIGDMLLELIFNILYRIFDALLRIVNLVESFFDIFAGTSKVTYEGDADFLINIFFRNDAVTNAFWGMTLIAMVLAFMFCIYNVIRKVTDVTGTAKHTIGQIMSNFFRCMLTLVLLNALLIAGLNISNVLLDRINFTLLNAGILTEESDQREFSESEYATMARVLATVGNYSVNPSYNSRYNINSCFNAVRGDLYSLEAAGVFDYEYEVISGSHCWQSALALLASSADLTTELTLDEYNAEVVNAYETIVYQLNYNRNFKPVEAVDTAISEFSQGVKTDVLIFLSTTMEAANNKMYNSGDIYDTIRIGYINGSKEYTNLDQVRRDFNIREIDYLVGYVVSVVFILVMAICIFTLIVRLFNLLLLYVSAPLFVSSMPLDEGAKFQNWIQAFIIQMFSGFGMVVAMRLYLIMVPVIMSSDLVFFTGHGIWYSFLNLLARLFLVLGGAWAVLKSSSVIGGILQGNPGMAALQQEGQTNDVITSGAKMALGGSVNLVKGFLHSLPVPKKGKDGDKDKDKKDSGSDKDSESGSKSPSRNRGKQTSDRAESKSKNSKDSSGGASTPSRSSARSDAAADSDGSASAPKQSDFKVPDYPKPPPLSATDHMVQKGSESNES